MRGSITTASCCSCVLTVVVRLYLACVCRQDWGPAFVPAGISGGVELVGFDRATLIGE